MKCNLCNSKNIRELYNFKEYKIMKCKKCNLIFTDLNSIKKTKEELYNDKYFTEIHTNFFSDCYLDYEEKRSKKVKNFKKGIASIERYIKKGKILDIGCATGVFLDIARKMGWDVTGIDISKYATDYAKEKFKIKVKKGEFKDIKFQNKKFDVITMWDFIEHTDDPKNILKKSYKTLKSNGIVFIVTINEESLMCWIADFLYKIKIKFFAKLMHPIHHNYHFSEKTLNKLLRKTKFQVIHKEKSEMPIENVEGPSIIRMIYPLGCLLSKITKTEHEITIIARKK